MTDVKENSTLVQHKIAVEDDERAFEHKYTWSSCCLRVDKRALAFFTQATFSGSIVAFCIAMLIIKSLNSYTLKYSYLEFWKGRFLREELICSLVKVSP